MVELEGFGVAGCVEFSMSASANKVFREDDGEAQDFVKHGGEERVGIVCAFRESAKELLIHLRRGHQTVHVQATGNLEACHCQLRCSCQESTERRNRRKCPRMMFDGANTILRVSHLTTWHRE